MDSQLGVLPQKQTQPRQDCRTRVRFNKTDKLRFIGHQDLVRMFERACRRAEIPVASTSGFHPKFKIIFALSLPLGVVGKNEIVDLVLTTPSDCSWIKQQLKIHLDPGLEILSVEIVDGNRAPKIVSLVYRFPLTPELEGEVLAKVDSILTTPDAPCLVNREGKKLWDIRPFIRSFRIENGALVAGLWFTQEGTAKPAEIIFLLGLDGRLPPENIVERLELELEKNTPSLKGKVIE